MKIMILAATLVIAMPAFAQDTAPAPNAAPRPYVAPLEDSIPPIGCIGWPGCRRLRTDAASLPICSKNITDRCIQRGAVPGNRGKNRR